MFVFVGLGERLYTDLAAAMTLPADAERKMAEEAAAEGIDYRKIDRQSCLNGPSPAPGGPVGPLSVVLLCGIFDSQRGKPDVIGEISRNEFEKLLGPSTPATERDH